ncbi:MAG: acyl-CoA carboxylase subunit epsilon [Firmicutes bacterium]|nr:acyl-CoA carboxylase subunit epsilon [Bacillota bacterium]
MKETVSISLEIYLLGLIAFLLAVIMFMLRKVIQLLITFPERNEQIAAAELKDYGRSVSTMDCTEEELAAITAVLARLLPDKELNIVDIKPI